MGRKITVGGVINLVTPCEGGNGRIRHILEEIIAFSLFKFKKLCPVSIEGHYNPSQVRLIGKEEYVRYTKRSDKRHCVTIFVP